MADYNDEQEPTYQTDLSDIDLVSSINKLNFESMKIQKLIAQILTINTSNPNIGQNLAKR